jgi:hypothetical protein
MSKPESGMEYGYNPVNKTGISYDNMAGSPDEVEIYQRNNSFRHDLVKAGDHNVKLRHVVDGEKYSQLCQQIWLMTVENAGRSCLSVERKP